MVGLPFTATQVPVQSCAHHKNLDNTMGLTYLHVAFEQKVKII